MASMPSRPLHEPAPTSPREEDVRLPRDEQARRAHRERVRISLAWAAKEFASTMAKLAK